MEAIVGKRRIVVMVTEHGFRWHVMDLGVSSHAERTIATPRTRTIASSHDDWLAFTDIHENSLGSMAIAKEVWRVMQDECIAQKRTNACCEPQADRARVAHAAENV